MTLTIALIVNGVLVAALFVALFLVMRIPFRIDRPERAGTGLGPAADSELPRAA